MRKWMLVFLMVMSIVGVSRRVEAAQQVCFTDFAICEYQAAAESSFWWRLWAGLDCEVSLWSCLRDALFW